MPDLTVTPLRFRYPSLPTYAVVTVLVPVFFYAASTQSTLPLDLLNSLHIREFTFQQVGLACLGAYAVGLMNIRFFRQRLLRKHSPALARLELMRKVERLAADKYPLAARHAREVKCDLQKQYGNLADPRTESVLTAIGIAFKALKKLFGGGD